MSIVLELAKKRKTARKFKKIKIESKELIPIIETASQAPSAANDQPWRFLIVNEKKIREASEEGEKKFYKIVKGNWAEWLGSHELNWKKPNLESAPILIIVLARKDAPYYKESVWLSIGYMLLALEELGLSALPYTPSYPKKVLKVLEIPEYYELEAILLIGHTADDKLKEDSLEVNQLYRINYWKD